jgi:hypothetical protein
MARGWESKAIESQQDDAARSREMKPASTEEERARAAERMTLALTRARVAGDLDRATALAHRRMLERALADLDARLDTLG